MKLLAIFLLGITFPVTLPAAPPEAADLDALINQLHSARSLQGMEAEQALVAQAGIDRTAVRDKLWESLAQEDSVANRHRLRRVLELVAPTKPLERVVFTAANLEEKVWAFNGKKPEHARYLLRDGVLEFNSLKDLTEAMGFVHRFDPAPAMGDPEHFLFGPALPREPRRLVLDAEIQVREDRLDRGGLAGVHLNVEDHQATAGLMILKDGIFAYRHPEVHKMDTTDRFHHYRIVIEGDHQEIFVDDMETPVLTVRRSRQAGRHWVTFGDGTAGGGAHARIRNVVFSRYAIGENGDG